MKYLIALALAVVLVAYVDFTASAPDEPVDGDLEAIDGGDLAGFGRCGIFNMKACCKYCVHCVKCHDPKYCPGDPNCKYCNKCGLCKRICR